MKKYLVRLTPQEPYFFGNEKCLSFNDGNPRGQMSNRYYIRSEKTPLQTTLFGAMRYLLLPEKKTDYKYDEEYLKKHIGTESFRIDAQNQDFGVIKRISPQFLLNGESILIPTPLDHIQGEAKYTPFSDYHSIVTADGNKLFTKQFDVKEGLTNSYTRLDTGKIVKCEDIFYNVTRVGINKTMTENAFFKKEYISLAKDYSFGFFIELSDDADISKAASYVYLGQSKSSFNVSFEETEIDIKSMIEKLLRKNTAYCFGDTLTNNSIYEKAQFAVVDLRDYRAYETAYKYIDGGKVKSRVRKGNVLYKLIKAGSVFISDTPNALVDLCSLANCQKTGFNTIIVGTKEEELKNG